MDRGAWQAIVHCHLKAIIKHLKCPQPLPPRQFQKEPLGLGCMPDNVNILNATELYT